MAIERKNIDVGLGSLKPYDKNARTHSKEQVDQLAASIKEFGFTNPILIDGEYNVIAGHGRIEAAKLLGLGSVPAVMLIGLTPAQRRALVLADNQLGLVSGWDRDLLAGELMALDEAGFDLDVLGFSETDLDKLLGKTEAAAGEDSVPAVPEVPRTRLGDVWCLGAHRVVCGDSTSATAVAQALGEYKPGLMVTDPPYGVKYDPEWREGHDGSNVENRRTGVVMNDDRADWREAWALFPGNIAYVWHGALHSGVVEESLKVNGFKMRAQIIWAKNNMVFGRGDYHWQHEPCWYAVKGTGTWTGDRKQTTVWEFDNLNKAAAQEKENARTNHSTQKPVEAMRRPIINNSAAGDVVYDPFLGSGTTLIAAEATGRVCVGLELDPRYVDVIVARWEAFTGQKAFLAGGHDEQRAPAAAAAK